MAIRYLSVHEKWKCYYNIIDIMKCIFIEKNRNHFPIITLENIITYDTP